MNELKKFWNAVSEYSNLVETRKIQLEKEKELDSRLKKCDTCPYTVSEYLLNFRRLNRKLSESLYDCPFYEFPGKYVEQINTINSVQPDLDKKSEWDICKHILPDVTKRMDEIINNE